MNDRALIILLASIAALGPFTVDMYLPAMPAMAAEFAADIPTTQLTFSGYLFGFSIFHLFCGPLADRFGRKPVLLVGIALFVFASVGCAFSDNIGDIIFFRVLQGMGACVGPTLTRTIARDVFGADGAARALSLMAMIMTLGPAVAPLFGGLILYFFHWSSIFIFLALYGALIWFLINRYLQESLPASQSILPSVVIKNYFTLMKNRIFISSSIVTSMMYSGLMIYLASSGFVYVQKMGVRVEFFGFILLTLVGGYALGSGLSAWMSKKIDSSRAVVGGTFLASIATGIMLLTSIQWPLAVMSLAAPMGLYTLALGIVLPHSIAITLAPFPDMAGTTSSLLGFIQMGVSAFFAVTIGGLITYSISYMVVGMLAVSSLAFLVAFFFLRNQAKYDC
ncbi:MAG: hypothetical protein CBE15_00685 [Euryarchaeota archaeon TMED255]|nr:MAG: hypothetical protein CBE15_00685 [Euryarchaeota archaeon TMED255]